MIRAFIALLPPDDLRDRLEDLALDLDEGRPTAWENLHLTLAFLGEQRPELLEDVAVELESLAPPAPTVALRGVGAFGGGRPRSAHVEVQADPALTAKPLRSSAITWISLGQPGADKHKVLSSRSAPSPQMVISGASAFNRACRSSRKALIRFSSSADPATDAAAPNPAIPATFSVPARRFFS